jgi:hypothetical protein
MLSLNYCACIFKSLSSKNTPFFLELRRFNLTAAIFDCLVRVFEPSDSCAPAGQGLGAPTGLDIIH